MSTFTWKNLAAELGVSAFSLHRWRHLEGAPVGPDLEEWKRFKAQRGLGRDRATPELATLRAELLGEQIQRERARNAREAGDVIDRDVVEEMLVTLGQKLDLLLRLKLEVELPSRCVGKSIAELGIEGATLLEEIREVVNANIAKFESEALAQSRDSNG